MEPTSADCNSSAGSSGAKPSATQQQQQPTDIPEGLYDLLKGVTVAVLRDRPTDLYSFVADYFTKVRCQLHAGPGSFIYLFIYLFIYKPHSEKGK